MRPPQYRNYPIDLSPWVRAVAGDISDLDLPKGYRITGLAKTAKGPYSLALRGPSTWSQEGQLAEQHVTAAADVRTWIETLVNLAWIDHQQKALRVGVDRAGWITSIEEG